MICCFYGILIFPNDWDIGFFSAVMETDGFDHLKESCPSVLTELLDYVAKMGLHPATCYDHGGIALDGSDANGRRVKQRLY